MALDKLVDGAQLDSALTATANAIRSKTGDSGAITWDFSTGFADAVDDIQTGGGSGITVTELSITENGTYTAPTGSAYSPVTVNVQSSGGGSSETSGVIFIDYDGTELYTYTTGQAMALTALPANPTHTGLTAQGWNWSLAQIKTYLQKHPTGIVVVGQLYITDDGKTRIYIHLEEGRLSPILAITLNGSVDVDWGDGTSHGSFVGSSTSTLKEILHEYAAGGDYVISLTPGSEGTRFSISGSSTGSSLLKADSTSSQSGRVHYNNAVKKIEFGSGITELRPYALYGCFSLASVSMTKAIVTTDPADIFTNCYSLVSLTLPDGTDGLGGDMFKTNCSLKYVSIPNYCPTFGNSAFSECYSLKAVTLPDGMKFFGSSMFYNCCSLEKLIIPDSVISIGGSAFSNTRFKNINLPDGITNITGYLFQGNTVIENITIPEGVTGISNSAFQGCYSLKEIIIPDGVASLGSSAFDSCRSLKNIELPDSITTIYSNAFRYCYALETVVIPSGVTSIQASTFQYCYSLTGINIPDGVTNIGNNAFANCYGLSRLTIPSGVTTMGSNVFYNCYGMREYHFKPTTPPTIGSSCFYGMPNDCIIYVPYSEDHSVLDAYKTASNWSSYASKIQEEPQ